MAHVYILLFEDKSIQNSPKVIMVLSTPSATTTTQLWRVQQVQVMFIKIWHGTCLYTIFQWQIYFNYVEYRSVRACYWLLIYILKLICLWIFKHAPYNFLMNITYIFITVLNQSVSDHPWTMLNQFVFETYKHASCEFCFTCHCAACQDRCVCPSILIPLEPL